jgi:hypothetical protein
MDPRDPESFFELVSGHEKGIWDRYSGLHQDKYDQVILLRHAGRKICQRSTKLVADGWVATFATRPPVRAWPGVRA